MIASANPIGLVHHAVVMVPLMVTGDFLPVVTARVRVTVNGLQFLSAGIITTTMAMFGVLHLVLGLMTIPLPAVSTRTLMMRLLPLPFAMMIHTYLHGLTDALELLQELTMAPTIAALTGRCVSRPFLLL